MKIPAHIAAFAVGIVVLILSTIIILQGHAVPTWFTWVGISSVAGGLGIAVPQNLLTALSSTPPPAAPIATVTTSLPPPA